MSLLEIMTILVLFHMGDYRTLKHFYLNCVLSDLKSYFPKAFSYERFVQLASYALMPVAVLFNGLKGKETGIYYVDSTSIKVCHTEYNYKTNKTTKWLWVTDIGVVEQIEKVVNYPFPQILA